MKALAFISLILLSGCIEQAAQKTPQSTEVLLIPKAIVSAHVDAFNKGDVAGMSKMQHPRIEWLNIEGSNIKVEVSGRDALARNMELYFKSPSRVTATLRDWNLNGNYISATETVRWKTKAGEAKSQSALTVYEIEDNLIRRVWYYPAVED